MKTCLLFFALSLSQTLYAQSSWKPLGGNGGLVSELTSARSLYPAIATDTAGTPYIVYMDVSDSSTLVVKKFNGTNWVPVGNLGYHLRGGLASIFISKKDSIYVGYFNLNDSVKPTVIKYDGTNWVQVGNTIPKVQGSYYDLSIAVDDNDKIYIGYGAYSSGPTYPPGRANIMTYDGTDWVQVGNTDFVQYTGRISLRIGLNNELYVGYDTYYLTGITPTNSHVQKWNGSQWDTVGTPLYPIYNIDIASDGTLYAMDDQANHGVSVKKLVNNGWGLQGNTYQYDPDGVLVIDKNNVPHIVVGSGVIKYDGTNWGGYGDTLVTQTNYILNSRLAFGKNNIPYVTGRNGSSQNEKIFAFYYDSVLTSIKELKNKQQITVYPNPVPTTDLSFFIEAQNLGTEWYDLTLFNSIGQLVFTDKVYHEQGTSIFIHPKATLQTGKYYIRLSGKRKDVVAFLMVQ